MHPASLPTCPPFALADPPRSYDAEHDDYLVVSFVADTRVLRINEQDELDEAEIPGFSAEEQTILCANMRGDLMLQVTRTGARLVRCADLARSSEWNPPSGLSVIAAAASPSQVLVATGNGHVVLLDASSGQLVEAAHRQLPAEVSCLDIHPLGPGAEATGRAAFAAAGLWNNEVHVLSTGKGLETVTVEALGGEHGVIPRSCILAPFEGGLSCLLVGLGDGQLYTFTVEESSGQLCDKKRATVGTKPISLRRLLTGSQPSVFAASDRPTVIYSSKRKLLFSNVNIDEVQSMASFNSSSFPDSLALVREGALAIGSIDDIQKLHIRTVPLDEQPRRIAHQESTRTFAVCTIDFKPPQVAVQSPVDAQVAWVRLLDSNSFDTLSKYQLEPAEEACSIATCTLAGQEVYAVGTAYVLPDQEEPTRGRILLLQVQDQRLVLVGEKEARGAVWQLEPFQGKLLGSVNQRVHVFKAGPGKDEGSVELQTECTYNGHTLSLYLAPRGDTVAVGDLMKSISLIQYKAEEGAFEERARDYNCQWLTALQALDDDTFLAAENNFNLFVARKNSDAATDEDRSEWKGASEGWGFLLEPTGAPPPRRPARGSWGVWAQLLCQPHEARLTGDATARGGADPLADDAVRHRGGCHRRGGLPDQGPVRPAGPGAGGHAGPASRGGGSPPRRLPHVPVRDERGEGQQGVHRRGPGRAACRPGQGQAGGDRRQGRGGHSRGGTEAGRGPRKAALAGPVMGTCARAVPSRRQRLL